MVKDKTLPRPKNCRILFIDEQSAVIRANPESGVQDSEVFNHASDLWDKSSIDVRDQYKDAALRGQVQRAILDPSYKIKTKTKVGDMEAFNQKVERFRREILSDPPAPPRPNPPARKDVRRPNPVWHPAYLHTLGYHVMMPYPHMQRAQTVAPEVFRQTPAPELTRNVSDPGPRLAATDSIFLVPGRTPTPMLSDTSLDADWNELTHRNNYVPGRSAQTAPACDQVDKNILRDLDATNKSFLSAPVYDDMSNIYTYSDPFYEVRRAHSTIDHRIC